MVYVLELEGSRYYVGYTENANRLSQHFTRRGAAWTRKYKPLRVVEIVQEGDKVMEREKTLEYMRRYGWENVRGYAWSQCNLVKAPSCLYAEERSEGAIPLSLQVLNQLVKAEVK